MLKKLNLNREFGIDLLRILAMFLIVVLHIIGEGGLLSSVPYLSDKYSFIWLLKIMCYCAVDCYAMVSGYVMYNRTVTIKRIISLWIQVLFYSIVIFIFFFIFNGKNMDIFDFFKYLTPLSRKLYWYLTAYFGLLFFVPFLNIVINKLDKKALFLTILNILLIFSINPLSLCFDTFKIDNGYSILWLMILYLLGGFISKYKISSNIRLGRCLLFYFIGVGCTWFSKMAIEWIFSYLDIKCHFSNIFIKYNSITILLSAVALLLFFSKVKFKNLKLIKTISKLSSLTLGVYLVHSHPLIYYKILHNSFVFLSNYSLINIIMLIVVCASILFIFCILIERVRLMLFDFIHMESFYDVLSNRIVVFENCLFNKFFK